MRLIRRIQDLSAIITTHELSERSAVVSYYLTFAIFPFLVAVLGLLSTLDLTDQMALLRSLLEEALPSEVASPLIQELEAVAYADALGRIVLGLAVSLYSSQRAMMAVINGVNAAWGTGEDRRPLLVRGLGVGLTMLVMLALLLALFLLTLGNWILQLVGHFQWLDEGVVSFLELLRWPIVLVLVMILVNVIYRVGANTPLRFAWSTWGSLFATLGWVVVTLGFELYMENVGVLGAAYGALGAAIGLLAYFYAQAFVLLLGAEIDAFNWRRRDSMGPADTVEQVIG